MQINAQSNRYLDSVFATVTRHYNVTFGSALPYQRVDGNEILYKDLVSKLSIALTSLSITTSTRERLRYVNEINELNHKIGLLLENFF